MSYGSISEEAHETLAIAMIIFTACPTPARAGESDERLDSAGSDVDRCSAIKQVASGRFVVTSRYLVSAREIQIKMAQGASLARADISRRKRFIRGLPGPVTPPPA